MKYQYEALEKIIARVEILILFLIHPGFFNPLISKISNIYENIFKYQHAILIIMESKVYPFAIGVWFVIVVLAILNGIMRESLYNSLFDPLIARAVSSIVLIVLIFVIVYISMTKSGMVFLSQEAIWLGAFWLALTIIFEFLFGHFIMGNTWSELLQDYNILEGHLWPLVLVTVFISPYAVSKFTK